MNLQDAIDRLKYVRAVLSDIDGIFTDGNTWQNANGELRRVFSIRDSMNVRALQKAEVVMAGFTYSEMPNQAEVRGHLRALQMPEIEVAGQEKRLAIERFASERAIDLAHIAVITRQANDVYLLTTPLLVCSIAGAPSALRSGAVFSAARPGGDGAVMEICQLILKAIAKRQGEEVRSALGNQRRPAT